MDSFFDKLGLRPAERRLVVGVGVVLFIVLNVYLVWPHFKDWKILRDEIRGAEATIKLYRAEAAKITEYEARQAQLEVSGTSIPTADMALALLDVVQPKARQAGVTVTEWKPSKGANSGANEFFEEHQLRIGFRSTDDEALLKFLVSLGNGESVIRIRELSIRPEATKMTLMGSITMVGSYQKALP
jgi:hypothetical protein